MPYPQKKERNAFVYEMREKGWNFKKIAEACIPPIARNTACEVYQREVVRRYQQEQVDKRS